MTRLALSLLVLAFGASACAGGSAPSGSPERPQQVTSAPAITELAPRVMTPRDAHGIAACNLMTEAQLEALGVDPRTAASGRQGDADRCEWRTSDGNGALAAFSAPDFPVGGLEGLYLVRSTYNVFEPGELDGHPVVRADRVASESPCTIYVGVADDQLAWTSAALVADPRSACDTARRMASSMISNLPPLH